MISILNNAADASNDDVEFDAKWTEKELVVEVRDSGAGLTPSVTARAGKTIFTTKSDGQGLGLGLFLAHATIGRLGGNVQLFNRDEGGACTRVTLPLSKLLATA